MTRRGLKRLVIGVIVLAALFYLGDFLSIKFRIPGNRQQTDIVQVQDFYAVKQKNGRIAYYYNSTENVTCSNSLFPQLGNQPCWYVRRNTHRHTNL